MCCGRITSIIGYADKINVSCCGLSGNITIPEVKDITKIVEPIKKATNKVINTVIPVTKIVRDTVVSKVQEVKEIYKDSKETK